jgi:hypothetical protein
LTLAGVLLDSGPLVLFICGSLRADYIGKGKTKAHTLEMYLRLNDELLGFENHFSLPNVLTEASNHLGAGRQQQIDGVATALSAYVLSLNEIIKPSKEVVGLSEYLSVGLADAAIISCVPKLRSENVKVYTQDWELYNRLLSNDIDCVNIMHWATPDKYRK